MNTRIKKLARIAANEKFPQKELHEFTNTAYEFYLKGYKECYDTLFSTLKEIAVPYPEEMSAEQDKILVKYFIAVAQAAISKVEPVKAIDLTKPDLFEQMADIVKTNVKNNYNLDL